MAIQLLGYDGTSIAAVDPTHKGLHATRRPSSAMGAFSLSGTSATTTTSAPSAGLVLGVFKWNSFARIALIRRLRLSLMVTSVVTGGPPEIAAYIARGYTVNPSGGTAVSFIGNNQKNRSSQPLSDMALAGGVSTFVNTGVTTGTRTVDAQGFLAVMAPLAIGDPIYGEFGGNTEDQPIVLYPNESIEMQNVLAISAGGYKFDMSLEWDEINIADWIG